MSSEERQNKLDAFFDHLTNNRTSGTSKKYRKEADKFEDWLNWTGEPVADRLRYDVDEPAAAILNEWDAFLSDQDRMREFMDGIDAHSPWNLTRLGSLDDGYSYNSRVQAVSAVKAWLDFEYKVEFGNREVHKVNHIVDGEPADFQPKVAAPDEVQAVFDDCWDCKSDSCYMMSRVGYSAVMRGIEITRVRREDVDLEEGRVYVRSAKGSPSRWIALSDDLVNELAGYVEMVDSRFDQPEHLFYKFTNFRPNTPWSSGTWSRHFKKHWEHGWHSFGRHSAIVNRLSNGESMTDVQIRARHAREANTQKYISLVNNGESVPPELRGGSRDYSSR